MSHRVRRRGFGWISNASRQRGWMVCGLQKRVSRLRIVHRYGRISLSRLCLAWLLTTITGVERWRRTGQILEELNGRKLDRGQVTVLGMDGCGISEAHMKGVRPMEWGQSTRKEQVFTYSEGSVQAQGLQASLRVLRAEAATFHASIVSPYCDEIALTKFSIRHAFRCQTQEGQRPN